MSKINQPLRVISAVIIGFSAYYVLFLNFSVIKTVLDQVTHYGLLSYILTYLIVGIPIFLGTIIINRSLALLQYLGLSSNIWTGFSLGLLFTIPMFLGSLLFFNFKQDIHLDTLIASTIIAGFMEELYFRAFLFGQVFKKTTIGFIPAIILGAVLFAMGHLYQSNNINELIGIFLVTFSGAIFFAWLYVEWKYNLWVPIFLHAFMNLSWLLFDVDDSALGDTKANIFRGLTICIAIVFTIRYKRRRNEKLLINRQTLIKKKED